jgi:hypothetical protein
MDALLLVLDGAVEGYDLTPDPTFIGPAFGSWTDASAAVSSTAPRASYSYP